MTFVPAPSIVQVEVRGLNDNQKIENRFNIDTGDAVDAALVQAVTEAVDSWAVDTYFPLLPNSIEYTESFGKDLTTDTGAQFTKVPTSPVFGGQASEPAPNEVSFCISLRSGFAGRSARGRFYVLGIPKALIVANTINSTLRGQLVAAGQALIDLMVTNGWKLSVVSYVSGGVPRVGGPIYFAFTTALSVDPIVDSQRRRKPGNGS